MNRPLSRNEDIIVQETDDEILIYDLLKNKAFCLNQMSAVVWQECDGEKTVAEISQSVSKKLRAAVSNDVVWLALIQLRSNELLDRSYPLTTPFDGLTRREVVKRVGLASAVALPMISSIIVPTAVNALSAAPVVCDCNADAAMRARRGGCFCTMNNDCCTNSCNIGPGNFSGHCTAGTIPAGGASCCTTTICPSSANMGGASAPGCPCNDATACSSTVCADFPAICAG